MHNLKLYAVFVGLIVIIMALCDTLIYKVVNIYGYDFAASGIIYSLSFFLASIMTEVYGYKLAGRVVWIQFMCHLLFVVTVNTFVIIPTSPNNTNTELMYFSLYKNYWHVLLGSCIAMPTAYFVNDMILSKLKLYLYGQSFIYRFLFSNFFGSGILVSISYPINFYHQFPPDKIAQIAIHTWIYKVIIALLLMPIGIWLAKIVKKIEGLDYYDYGISYNPLKVFKSNNAGVNKYANC